MLNYSYFEKLKSKWLGCHGGCFVFIPVANNEGDLQLAGRSRSSLPASCPDPPLAMRYREQWQQGTELTELTDAGQMLQTARPGKQQLCHIHKICFRAPHHQLRSQGEEGVVFPAQFSR